MNIGFRKTNFTIHNNFVLINYYNFTKYGKKYFQVKIPKFFKLNKEFSYFFGLWCGDRAGGKRMGIVNQNKDILDFSESWLKKNGQNIEKILYFSELVTIPKVKYDKKFVLKTDKKGWVLSLHSNNGIFSSFFHYICRELEKFISYLDLENFFAGLFDAEGNVSLYNRSFRFACKDSEKIKIYSLYLKKVGFKTRYDGGCIIVYDLDLFYKRIYPFIKHSEKRTATKFLCTGGGEIPANIASVLDYVRSYPDCSQIEIAKALKKNKVFQELKLLCDFKYISHKGYPFRYFTNT